MVAVEREHPLQAAVRTTTSWLLIQSIAPDESVFAPMIVAQDNEDFILFTLCKGTFTSACIAV